MSESDLLSHIYTRSSGLSALFPQVITGPGHDCAVIRSPSGDDLLLKVDQLVEGVHVRPIPETPIDLVARKAIARAVSDIAAAGGTPMAALAAGTLPPVCPYADALFDAMARWARHWKCPLVGGDIASWAVGGGAQASDGTKGSTGPDRLVLSVSIIGRPHPQRGPVLRSGAKPGDGVYVTGAIGGSFDAATGLGRHLTFDPRLDEARWLCDTLGDRLHAMMDISDGLGRDAGRLAAASDVQIELDADLIPLHNPITGWRLAAAQGEDYELLFCVDASVTPPDRCPLTSAPITRIGRVTPGSGCVVHGPGAGMVDATEMGWDHP